MTDHDSILYLNNSVQSITNYPTSTTDPNAPRQTSNVMYTRVVEVSTTNSTLLNNWSLLDMLDPYHLTYLSLTPIAQALDTHHPNAVTQDPRDNSIIVSLRNQNAVVSFHPETGKLKWILGPHENWAPEFAPYLLKPVGAPFQWCYGQHAPRITSRGTLFIYDDGNFRATPFDPPVPDSQNYSRAVEYKIDESKMEISQVWEYGANVPEPLYTGSVGSAFELPRTGNVLISFGNVSWINHQKPSATAPNASMARIKEVTYGDNPEVVFDLSLFDYDNTSSSYRGNYVYRAYRITDLYAHPAEPVGDLEVKVENGVTHVRFSADPFRTYKIETTSNLAGVETWTPLATAELDEYGNCDFQEQGPPEFESERFFRVITN